MFCPNCGEHYNYYEPRCPWCGASKPQPKPHKESSNEKDETVEIDEKKLPLKTRLYSKRHVAALILFTIVITCLTVITREAFIAEYPDIINLHSHYFVAFVFLLSLPFLGILGYMYDSEQKRNPRDDSKDGIGSMFTTMWNFYYLAPFKYGYRCIKERNYKGLVLFAAFISVLALIFV